MKNSQVSAQLALVLSVVALFLIWATQSPSEEPEPLSSPNSLDAERLAQLEGRIDSLTSANRDLQEDLEALELRLSSAQRVPAGEVNADGEDLEAIRSEVRAELERRGESVGSGADYSPEFNERVSEAVEEMNIKKARERARRGVEKRTARLTEKLVEVSQQLGLNGTQEGSLEASLATLYDTQANYSVMWETGQVTEKAEFGEIMQSDMDLFLVEISGYLTPQQYDDYLNLDGGDLFPDGTWNK